MIAATAAPAAGPVAGAPAALPTTGPGRDISYNTVDSTALSPEEQRRLFKVPDGFEVELVAAESEGFGKFITVAWDARMRLWSMTALEYPVDGNEQQAASDALFAAGGRDKVVVFDAPYGEPAPGRAAVTTPPRVFAGGLVMPLGLQPWRDGAFVQYGADLRFYRDTDGDGRADRHDVILTGFGTQDSHLFPHQFHRMPGGAMFLAQGLFNYSTVRRPGGTPFSDGATEVAFNQCKLALVSLDGARFESVTAGPNNIWGLVTSRDGETFLQEANDQGYPVIPYAPGIHVRTGSRDRLRPYQPLMPPSLAPAQMGGTGLSGLALAEDRDGFRGFGARDGDAAAKIFLLANPITNALNAVRATPTADGARYTYERLPDFLTTADKWFRPVAIHFGPDGALYVVDWYNKIISHNEVPRTHPDRDKSRGRIWRIRHRDQPRTVPPDLTRLEDRALLAHLGGPNALVSRLAWLEIGDRRAAGLAPDLEKIAADRALATDRRLAALWALETLRPLTTPFLQALAADPAAPLRTEAARLAAAHARPEAEFVALATPLIDDARPAVRAAIGDALRRVPGATAATMLLAARLGRAPPPADAPAWPRYDRDFERYLARWAMEKNPRATAALLTTPAGRALPAENRLLAALALPAAETVAAVLPIVAELPRPLAPDEVAVLAPHADTPAVLAALRPTFASAAVRPGLLRTIAERPAPFEAAALRPLVESVVRTALAAPAEKIIALQAIAALRLAALADDAARCLGEPAPATRAEALRTLAALRAGPVAAIEALAGPAQTQPVRAQAVSALAQHADPAAAAALFRAWPQLPRGLRHAALEALTSRPAGAQALAAALKQDTVARADLSAEHVRRVRQHAGEDFSAPAAAPPPDLDARFAKYRALAAGPGDAARGRALFPLCAACHPLRGEGGQIGPPLDGLGLQGTETLLRHLLTPNAAMEPGYRTFQIETTAGEVIAGFFVAQNDTATTVRLVAGGERTVSAVQIRRAQFLPQSLMPEGLLEGLDDTQARDLLAYLLSLR